MQLLQLYGKRNVSFHLYQRRKFKRDDNRHHYLKWFSAPSMVFSAVLLTYMEPKTTTTFSQKFQNDGDILEIIYTGYHRWQSQSNKSYHFMNEFNRTFHPHFCYAVYRKKYTMEEALDIERQNADLETYDDITSNDFPYHYNRAKKRREDELMRMRDQRWEHASSEERRAIYEQVQSEKKRKRKLKDLRRKRRGTSPKASEAQERHPTEITEKLSAKRFAEEAEEYAEHRDFSKQREVMLELMESEDAMNNLYIFHIKFLMDWTSPDLMFILLNSWNDFGLLNYSTHTQQTLSAIKLMNNLEDNQKIHEGDELLVVVNEPNHELQIYFKDNYIPIGYEGSSKHISQKNKQKQKTHYDKWIKHSKEQPFECRLTVKTDLLNECFKVFFLQNSKTCRITTPSECGTIDEQSEFENIKKKYGLS